jgi:mRNA interferase MazF
MIQRADVVIVDFPYTDVGQSKRRPAVVVQNDRDNQRLRKTVVAMITGNLKRRGDPSHVFIDPAAEPSAGLSHPSLISC